MDNILESSSDENKNEKLLELLKRLEERTNIYKYIEERNFMIDKYRLITIDFLYKNCQN